MAEPTISELITETPQKLLPAPGYVPPEPPEPKKPPSKNRAAWVWIAIFCIAALGASYWVYKRFQTKSDQAAADKKGNGKQGNTSPVVTTKAHPGNIGVYYNGLGNITPIYTVTIKSRVDGELMRLNYQEGQTVQKGDLLAEIDPRPYQVQLEQAEGQLNKDQAILANARTDLTRYETLLKQNAIPEQQVATQRSTVVQDEAVIKSDQGSIDAAKLNLIYTKITAPITGRIGLRLVDPGNIVHASDSNGLLVITQIEPISALFTLSEDQLPSIMKKLKAGVKLPVEAWDRELKNKLSQGTLETVDNQIDQTTGTVRLRALFDNKDDALFPNQFVNIRLLLETKYNVVLIPTAAIQRSSSTTFVYVINPDSTVAARNITEGVTEGDNSEITSGLKANEVIVLTGADRLQEGAKVATHDVNDKSGSVTPPPGGAAPSADKQKGKKKK